MEPALNTTAPRAALPDYYYTHASLSSESTPVPSYPPNPVMASLNSKRTRFSSAMDSDDDCLIVEEIRPVKRFKIEPTFPLDVDNLLRDLLNRGMISNNKPAKISKPIVPLKLKKEEPNIYFTTNAEWHYLCTRKKMETRNNELIADLHRGTHQCHKCGWRFQDIQEYRIHVDRHFDDWKNESKHKLENRQFFDNVSDWLSSEDEEKQHISSIFEKQIEEYKESQVENTPPLACVTINEGKDYCYLCLEKFKEVQDDNGYEYYLNAIVDGREYCHPTCK